ncbi:hypothetical protein CQP30_01185 [Yersinia pestis]|uniref:Uncharacterized protein n=14 Tax=Yersinia pseudotuberculosis complex TaxID=1649845 RepID=A0A3G5L7Q8_YERPE|nr:hypothetical [Yersinia pestis KIM10+]AAS60616.1 hypothetical protein YP_0343 [Yersinia pestis biovar Microtus str. 91001]ABG14761.1 hypothetical protein YPA_2799 [Yersinia pestis Antiqua]ABG17081.1 hypothetical protein YPN_0749 [Yersinia pestis Nepal516]ABP41376.1 hypothetical protein YPDSF_3016 [Yersinia pestis Pestoides F]ADW00110.1 hypothetical protein YPC_3662 [Yersinia pestis biovar Medievalis str. Harbin 35]AEL72493.1 hypothetical protein A1122_09210 [Yersinia pestis A1122]AXY35911.
MMLIHAKAKQPKLNDNKSLKHEQTTKIAYVNRVKKPTSAETRLHSLTHYFKKIKNKFIEMKLMTLQLK